MTLADFYLLCFFVGFIFSVVSLLMGHVDLHALGGHDFHLGGHGHGDIGTHGHGHGHGHSHAPQSADGPSRPGSTQMDVSPFNAGTVSAFLAWFGGTGYLATQYYRVWFLLGLLISVISGLVGASIVFWFLAKVLMREPEHLDPAVYDMVGVLGSVSSTIRPDGVGEILFSQQGVRKSSGARSEDGSHIPVGIEVVVTRFQDGIAYVRRWDELTGAAAMEEGHGA